MKRIYNGVEVTYQNETDYLQSNVVYLITFPDGKYYVGRTVRKLHQRVANHCFSSQEKNDLMAVNIPIREHNQFNIRILYTTVNSAELKYLETKYTIEYNSYMSEFGYNSHIGDSPSINTKLKISESNKGKVNTPEHNKKISESNKGKIYTDEHNKRLSEANSIKIFDDFNNNFKSITHAAKFYKCGIAYVCYLLKRGQKSKKLGTRFYYV